MIEMVFKAIELLLKEFQAEQATEAALKEVEATRKYNRLIDEYAEDMRKVGGRTTKERKEAALEILAAEREMKEARIMRVR